MLVFSSRLFSPENEKEGDGECRDGYYHQENSRPTVVLDRHAVNSRLDLELARFSNLFGIRQRAAGREIRKKLAWFAGG
jgi:hypothetical protein